MDHSSARAEMLNTLKRRGITNQAVLQAMADVPRERFVEPKLEVYAYRDGPLPIPEGQTISQPYIVALMAQALELPPGARVLEVGAGSGYAAAVLSHLAAEVHTVERHLPLARGAALRLQELGCTNVSVHHGDGSLGWPKAAPFQAIVVAAGGPTIPPALRDQLVVGGRLVIPVGGVRYQRLLRVTRLREEVYETQDLGSVSFVPLVQVDFH